MALEEKNTKRLFPNFAVHPFPHSYGDFFVGGEEIELCVHIKPEYNTVFHTSLTTRMNSCTCCGKRRTVCASVREEAR